MKRTANIAIAAACLFVGGLAGKTAGKTAFGGEVPLVFGPLIYDQLPAPFSPTMFRIRDFDRDGFPDLLIAGRDPDDRLMTRRGLGNGHFAELQLLTASGFIDWLELGDLDADGKDDIVAAWRGDVPRLVCYRGIGPGLFEEATVLADVVVAGVGRDPQSVALGDYDQDGDLDVAVCNYIGQSIDVFSNRGALVFERTARVRLGTFLGGVGFPRIVAPGDMDGDGDLDLVVNELGGSRIAVLLNQGGRFVGAREYRVPQIGAERPGLAGMALIDVDGDGDLDALCPALLLETTQKVLAFMNDGTGALNERLVGDGSPTGYEFCVHLADFDGDGDLDAVSGAALPGTIAVGRRTSASAFSFEIDSALQFGQLIRHLDAADVDGDCDLDIIGIDGPGRTLFSRKNNTPQQGCGGLAEFVEPAPAPAKRVQTARLLARLLAREPVPRADRNNDGVFDAADVAIWLAEMSQVVPVAIPVKAGGAQ